MFLQMLNVLSMQIVPSGQIPVQSHKNNVSNVRATFGRKYRAQLLYYTKLYYWWEKCSQTLETGVGSFPKYKNLSLGSQVWVLLLWHISFFGGL